MPLSTHPENPAHPDSDKHSPPKSIQNPPSVRIKSPFMLFKAHIEEKIMNERRKISQSKKYLYFCYSTPEQLVASAQSETKRNQPVILLFMH
jgi:hypothetical protein